MDVTRLMRTALVGVLSVAVLALSATAADAKPAVPAQQGACSPQQTVAALDQYCDSLPGSNGQPQPAGPGQGPADRPPLSSTLPQSELTRLRRAGPAARALLTIPAGAAPGPAARKAERGASKLVDKRSRGDAPTAVATLVTAAPDLLGGAFRWGLVASTLGIIGMAWLRFRARMTR